MPLVGGAGRGGRFRLPARGAAGAKATLIGDPFQLESFTTLGNFVDNTETVGAGAEFFQTDGTPLSAALLAVDPNFEYSIDVQASSIVFFFNFNHQFSFEFTGLNWTDDPTGTITSVIGSVDFGGGMITATTSFDDQVLVQFDCIISGGVGCSNAGGSQFTVDITTDHDGGTNDNNVIVPEPTSLLLLGCGLAGLVGFGRKKLSKKA